MSVLMIAVGTSSGCGSKPSIDTDPEISDFVEPAVRDAELSALTGIWQYERLVVEGRETPADVLITKLLQIEGGELTRVENIDLGKNQATYFPTYIRVDPLRNPHRYDDVWPKDDGTICLKGIYKLDQDKLTLCFNNKGKARPTTFDSSPGSEFVLTVLRRANKDVVNWRLDVR